MALSSGAVFERVQVLQALGISLDDKASTDAMVEGRLSSARKMWPKLSGWLCSASLPWKHRLAKLYATIGASLLWGAGIWALGKEVARRVCSQETRWLRRMLGQRKLPDQTWVDWLTETKRAAHSVRILCGKRPMWARACTRVWGWHSHVARREPGHGGLAWLAWKDEKWWRIQQALGHFDWRQRRTQWRHTKKNWKRGGEKAVADYEGAEWMDRATRRETWSKCGEGFVTWANRRWGGPEMPAGSRRRERPEKKQRTLTEIGIGLVVFCDS